MAVGYLKSLVYTKQRFFLSVMVHAGVFTSECYRFKKAYSRESGSVEECGEL